MTYEVPQHGWITWVMKAALIRRIDSDSNCSSRGEDVKVGFSFANGQVSTRLANPLHWMINKSKVHVCI